MNSFLRSYAFSLALFSCSFLTQFAACTAETPPIDVSVVTRKLNALKLIWSDVEAKAIGSPKRQEYLREFQTESASLLETLPASHSAAGGLWALRALAGCELNDQTQATTASTKMLELGLDKSSNELIQKTLATLERKGWLKSPQQVAEERATENLRIARERAKAEAKANAKRERTAATEALLAKATENSIGMKFQPVPGTKVLFSIWETRVQDYTLFVGETGQKWKQPLYSDDFTLGPTHPATKVGWNEAKAFCAWLTRKEKKEGRIGAQQEYRLPTDLEWSAAVGLGGEAGTMTERLFKRDTNSYPWGPQWPPPPGAGNYGGEERGESKFAIKGYSDPYIHIAPVGSFSPNQFGLYDMGGNVQEWCEDIFWHTQRVLRDAPYSANIPELMTSSSRMGSEPNPYDFESYSFGFRVVLTVGELAR
jgi:hypothetical protein